MPEKFLKNIPKLLLISTYFSLKVSLSLCKKILKNLMIFFVFKRYNAIKYPKTKKIAHFLRIFKRSMTSLSTEEWADGGQAETDITMDLLEGELF